MKRLFVVNVLLALGSTLAAASGPIPVEEEFPVNTFTPARQVQPDIAMDSSGQFVVVWSSEDQDGSGFGIFGRRFNAQAVPIGDEFQVNSYFTHDQNSPRVTMDEAGNFVVVWISSGQDGDATGIFGRRFDSSGTPVGEEFQVSLATLGFQTRPDIAGDDAGNFIVTWESYPSFNTPTDIVARHFDSAGAPLGSEIVVSAEPGALEHSPAVAMNDTGRFVVFWGRPSADYGGLYTEIFGQRFDVLGQPDGDEFEVSTRSQSYYGGDYATRAAMNPEGDFVVVWERRVDLDVSYGVIGRSFDPNAVARGSTVPISASGAYLGESPDLIIDDDGGFMTVWIGSEGVIAERFDKMGNSDGGEVQVNNQTAWSRRSPAIAGDGAGNFVVVWSRRHTYYETDIIARRVLGTCTGPVTDLQVNPVNGGASLVLTWTDAVNAEEYVVLQDSLPNGIFSTQAGTVGTGVTGLTTPAPPGTVFYLVAGRNTQCGQGPLH